MNSEHLRQSLKAKWLQYYQDNRPWLTRLAVWVECEGQRRPSSGFILATLSTLEPRLTDLLPLVVDLNNNPDRIVIALGLNFNPDEAIASSPALPKSSALPDPPALPDPSPKLLSQSRPTFSPTRSAAAALDETCEGVGRERRTRERETVEKRGEG